MKPNYRLDLKKILLPKIRNFALAILVLFLLGTPLGKSVILKSGFLIIFLFPLVLFVSIFANSWFIQILDVIFLWVKSIDFEIKTINRRIEYDDFYLLEYEYQFTDTLKKKVFALLIITAAKKTKFKILFEADKLSDVPAECSEFIKHCQEQNKYKVAGSESFASKGKITIGRKTYTNWSYYQRIFVGVILWMLGTAVFIFLGIGLVMRNFINS